MTFPETRSLLNLAVDLGEEFDEPSRSDAVARIERAGFKVEERDGADDRTLAWIDLAFGGTWSGEAFRGANVIVRNIGAPVGFATYDPRGLQYRWLRSMGAQPGVGIFGPFGLAPEVRGSGIGPALLTIALCGLRRRGYATALIPAVGEEKLVAYYMEHAGARVVERYDRAAWQKERVRIVVMASGAGTNFAALERSITEGWLPLEMVGVVSNRQHAGVVALARNAGITCVVLPWQRGRETREHYDARLRHAVAGLGPQLILSLGWMHLLDAQFVQAFADILNLHPAFMPLDPSRDEVGMPDGSVVPVFRGKDAVRDAVAAGVGWIGATVHHVTADADRGTVVARVPMQLEPEEDAERAYERLRPIERSLVRRAITIWTYEH
jgi:phosphoribosylglycinamide formyltransferase 1